MNEPALPHTLVDLSVDIEATPQTVWNILTTPALFGSWMEGIVSFEPKAGSPFRAEFPAYQTVIAGEVVALDAEARHLGLTWGVETGPEADAFPAGSSLVEFRVHATAGGCRVELRHGQLPPEMAARQRDGWTFHLGRMSLAANRTDLGAGLDRTLRRWFAAWNERDDTARLAALRACCAADVEFRDDWTAVDGTEPLSLHIANCFRYMPDWRIEATGDVRICRGEALVGWRSVGPGGAVLEGHNHVRADADGTLRRVAGFQAG